MASRQLRKVISWGLAREGFTTDFNPNNHSRTWYKFQKYIDKKEKSVLFNNLFRPAFKAAYEAEIKKYLDGGHELSHSLKKGIKKYVKEQVKESVKAQLKAPINSTQQSYKEQEDVLPEG